MQHARHPPEDHLRRNARRWRSGFLSCRQQGWRSSARCPPKSTRRSGLPIADDRGRPWAVSTRSRVSIYGSSIRSSAERAKEARKEADRLGCEAWNQRMLGYKGPAQPSPALGHALNAGYLFLEGSHSGLCCDRFARREVGRTRFAVVQARAGRTVDVAAVSAFVKQRVGGVTTPKQIEVWDDLPRSKVAKVLKSEIRARMLTNGKT